MMGAKRRRIDRYNQPSHTRNTREKNIIQTCFQLCIVVRVSRRAHHPCDYIYRANKMISFAANTDDTGTWWIPTKKGYQKPRVYSRYEFRKSTRSNRADDQCTPIFRCSARDTLTSTGKHTIYVMISLRNQLYRLKLKIRDYPVQSLRGIHRYI